VRWRQNTKRGNILGDITGTVKENLETGDGNESSQRWLAVPRVLSGFIIHVLGPVHRDRMGSDLVQSETSDRPMSRSRFGDIGLIS
jgi:hypothetical protein